MRIKLIKEQVHVQCPVHSKAGTRGLSLACAGQGRQQAQHLDLSLVCVVMSTIFLADLGLMLAGPHTADLLALAPAQLKPQLENLSFKSHQRPFISSPKQALWPSAVRS